MTAPGEYADTLRSLGRFLEMVGASAISIRDEGDHMDVSWVGKGPRHEERRYEESELKALRTAVRMFRGIDGGTPPVTLSEILRTIGREMDEARPTAVSLEQTADGFVVSGRLGEERLTRHYSIGELIARARALHAERLRTEILMGEPAPAVPSKSAGAWSGNDLRDALRRRSLGGAARGADRAYRSRATAAV